MLERTVRRKPVFVLAVLIFVSLVNVLYDCFFKTKVNKQDVTMEHTKSFTNPCSACREGSQVKGLREESRTNNHHGYLIPDDVTIDAMNDTMLTLTYWRYINTIQFWCMNQTRIGPMKDGGKEICIDDKYRPRRPCLVYSFGSNYDFKFEQSMAEHFGCEIHTFDPSMAMPDNKAPTYTKFHKIGLAETDFTDTRLNWKKQRLATIIADLHHINRTIEVLKIDIEGDEWRAFPEMLQSGELQRVRQICIEVHFGQNPVRPKHHMWGNVTMATQLKVLRMLHIEGYRIFMREHNTFRVQNFIKPFHEITHANELSFVNLNLQYGIHDFDYRKATGNKESNFNI